MIPGETDPIGVEAIRGTSKRCWNHTPDQPVALIPLFDRPSSAKRIIQWLAGIWLPVSIRSAILALSILICFFLRSDFSRVATFKADWIAEIYLRKLVLITVVSGGCIYGFIDTKISVGISNSIRAISHEFQSGRLSRTVPGSSCCWLYCCKWRNIGRTSLNCRQGR